MEPGTARPATALAAAALTLIGAAGAARAQEATEVDWSLPDPFAQPAPTSSSTPARVEAPAESTALGRPLVLRSVVVYGRGRAASVSLGTRASLRSPMLAPAPAPASPVAPLPPPAPAAAAVPNRRAAARVASLDVAAPRARPSRGTGDVGAPRAREVREPPPAPAPAVARPARTPVAELPGDPPDHRALRALDADACFARLRDAGIAFERLDPAGQEGVEQPLVVRGSLGGVALRPYGTASGARVHQIIDCRLALAVLRAAPVFRAAGVREVRYLSIYRPGARVRSGRHAGSVSLHAHALAIDVPSLVRDDGSVLVVERDWGPAPLGAPVCGPDAVVGTSDASVALRAIACDLLERRAFQMILTPQYDVAHRNHFHMQLDPRETRTSVR